MERPYPPDVEQAMRDFFDSLSERQRRRYAALEALKLGRGAVRYLARVLDCDEKTIRRGRRELCRPDPVPANCSRKKGAGAGP